MSWGGGSFRFGGERKPQRKPVPAHVEAPHLLAFIVAYQREHGGVSPSFPEMAAGLGMAGKASVHRLLKRLIEDNKIRTLPHRARAIEVIRQEAGYEPPRITRGLRVPLVAPGPEAEFFVVAKDNGDDARLVPMGGKR